MIGCWINWPDDANYVKISSQMDDNWGFYKFHPSCWPLAYVDLLADVDLENNWWLNSVTWNANPLQISSQWEENWGF